MTREQIGLGLLILGVGGPALVYALAWSCRAIRAPAPPAEAWEVWSRDGRFLGYAASKSAGLEQAEAVGEFFATVHRSGPAPSGLPVCHLGRPAERSAE